MFLVTFCSSLLQFNFTNIFYDKKIYLDNNSFLEFKIIPQSFLNYSYYNFNKMTELIKTDTKSNVLVYNKNKTNPKYEEIKTNRWFKSYLNTPPIPLNINKSYMFSGYDKNEIDYNLPHIFKPFYEFFKRTDKNFNQMVINYYEKENDSIEMHSDWDDFMIKNYKIAILTLNEKNNNYKNLNRVLTIKSKYTNNIINIELFNGLIILMGGNFQKNFRHGINKISLLNKSNKRLGLTFRQFI